MHWVSSGLFGVAGFIGVRRGGRCNVLGGWVHWDAPWGSLGSLGVAGLFGVRPGVRRVRSVSLRSLECRWGRSGSLGSFRCAL